MAVSGICRSSSNPNFFFSFLSVTIFFFFEAIQMSYLNVLAPYYLEYNIYNHHEISILSASYFYGNMAGILPVGFILDKFSLRKIIIMAILGSAAGAFLLIISPNLHFQYIARFICGFFGGAVSFAGGMKLIASIYRHKFTFYMGLFVSAGMFGGLICQYPLLIITNKFGPIGSMTIVALLSIIVLVFNLIFLKPLKSNLGVNELESNETTLFKACINIISSGRNWLDCIMIVFLDTPISVIGTLWGIVLFSEFYHFSSSASSLMVMSLFAGIIIGSPLCGMMSDRYSHSKWIIISGSFVCACIVLVMIYISPESMLLVLILSFGLGVFSSCQTLGFTWLLKNMSPKFIGMNTAINSMIFMGANGLVKQISGGFLTTPSLISELPSAVNLLILILISMLLASLYALFRNNFSSQSTL